MCFLFEIITPSSNEETKRFTVHLMEVISCDLSDRDTDTSLLISRKASKGKSFFEGMVDTLNASKLWFFFLLMSVPDFYVIFL